jgi:hypothetical protein
MTELQLHLRKKENNSYLSLLQAVAAQAAPPVRRVVACEEEPGADPLLVARRCVEIVPLLALALPPLFSLNSLAANKDRRQNFQCYDRFAGQKYLKENFRFKS